MVLAACVATALSCGAPPAIAAGEAEGGNPILFQADEMTHDRELGIVRASGHVEVTHGDRILIADTITYNEKDDILSASGNVSMIEPTGEVLFAEYFELTGDMKNGTLSNLRMIMSDGARVAAAGGRRIGGVVHELNKVVYSPCNLCKDNPNRPPLWQVKAVRVTHDAEKHVISYRDAWLEVAGIPVAYTPYLSHPDPTVKRKSGFLAPSFGSSSDLGYVIRTPYYFAISPQADATVTPGYSSDEGPMMAGEYRQRLGRGEYEMSGSVTHDSSEEWRGHIDSTGRFDINDTWRAGFDVERATDDTYLRRYQFPSKPTLETRLFAEGFRKRNYLSANAFAFQGLRGTDDPGETPIILPMIDFHHVGEPSVGGGRSSLDANLTVLSRDDGAKMRRMSTTAGWERPYIAPLGDVYTLSASIRADGYHVDDQPRDNREDFSGATGRVIPEAALNWRFPFVRDEGNVHQLFEPIASFVVSPYGGNPDTIPNEDSIELEFDDTSLFDRNRFSGLDRVESGPRANYGVHWGVFGREGGFTDFIVGQSVRLQRDDTFAEGSGLEDNLSDVVTRLRMQPGKYFSLTYRARFNKDDLAARRNELQTTFGTPALLGSVGYTFFDAKEGSEFGDREQIRGSVSSQFTKYWRGSISTINDLTNEGDPLANYLSLVYEDECLIFSIDGRRTYFTDRDLQPTDSVMFHVVFKTLGEVRAAAF